MQLCIDSNGLKFGCLFSDGVIQKLVTINNIHLKTNNLVFTITEKHLGLSQNPSKR